MDQLVHLAGALLRRPVLAMIALPALVGLIPMPGGAVFSAPMVDAAAAGREPRGDRLSAINYWFRHIWEHWWPLYPGIILALTLIESDLGPFVAYQFPLCVLMILSGLPIVARVHPELTRRGDKPGPGTKRRFIRAMSPILVIVAGWVVGTVLVQLAAGTWSRPEGLAGSLRDAGFRFGPITLGLAASILWTIRLGRLDRSAVGRVVRTPGSYRLAVLVLVVMVFQHMVGAVDAAGRIAAELEHLRVPVAVVVAVLPLIAGVVTGLAIGFVGTSFPIVLPLVAALPGDVSIRPFVALAYAFGHIGQMLSPLHLCQIVSNRYFSTSYGPLYRRILLPAGLMAAAAVGYFALLRAILGD